MTRHLPLIVALLCAACGDTVPSPTASQASAPQPLIGSVVSIPLGEVRDTTNVPISGAEVQVLTGPSAGRMGFDGSKRILHHRVDGVRQRDPEGFERGVSNEGDARANVGDLATVRSPVD